ncbi:N-acetyltransferase [Kribbella antibiotica]|uniref:N-acetyltransferase n=1 Tax=Kribbella antibiotica TaxID=190195 RepID=A0A4R4ZSZ4_9ACTN|nr:GNAT family N-acetyltransferase [Kribbella antibiotica]TDD62173.1 N-acetyltransferase [Kribbella antibiotica]
MSRPPFTIRPAAPADRADIHQVLRQLHPDLAGTTLPRIRQEAQTFVAGEPVIGVAVVTFVDYRAGAYGMVEELVVDAAHRGTGVGRLLLDECRGWLARLGAEVIFVSGIDEAAAGFYRRAGFADCTGPWLFQGADGGV